MEVTARPLEPEAFRPFGTVLRAGVGEVRSIRDGAVRLTHSDAAFDHDARAATPAIDLYEVAAEPLPLAARRIERHPFSVQIFSPVRAARWLVAVWPDGPEGRVEAFVAGPEDGVLYRRGLWHHGVVALDAPALFHSFMWRTGTGGDTEFADPAAPPVIHGPGA